MQTSTYANISAVTTTVPSLTAREILEALPEPSVVLDTTTCVLMANLAALTRFGPLVGLKLTGFATIPDAAALRTYIRRCSGSRGTLPGTVTLRGADGTNTRFRCFGGLVVPACDDASAMVLLRCSEAEDERFSALARDVRRLNVELRERHRTQALLEEALRDREVMLRELHHRVKNSIQMLIGMVGSVRREVASPEARAVLANIGDRLGAIGAAHQMLHRVDSLGGVDARRFAAELSGGILHSYGAQGRLSCRATAGAIIPNDVATPLALILNELLVNAVKHGPRDGHIRVGLLCAGGMFEVSVEDDGPGFEFTIPAKRASGLGLVCGLARQLRGSFAVERGERGGTRCVLRFSTSGGAPDREEAERS